MTYAAPTADNLRARYPAFENVATYSIEQRLSDAADECANISDTIRARAEMALAAHMLIEAGEPKDLAAQGVSGFSSGDFSISYGDAANRTGLEATVYGREFKRLARASFGGPRMSW